MFYMYDLTIVVVFLFLCSIGPVFIAARMKKRKINHLFLFLLAFFTPPFADLFTIGLFNIYIPSLFSTKWIVNLWILLEFIYIFKIKKEEKDKQQTNDINYDSVNSFASEPVASSTNESIQSSSVDVSHNTEEEIYHSRYYSPHSQFSNEAMYSNKKTSSESSLISDELVESYKKGYPKKAKSFIDEWDEKYSNKALAQQNLLQEDSHSSKVKVKPVKRK